MFRLRGLFLGIVLDRDVLFGRVKLDIVRNAVGSIQMGVEDLEASNGDSRRAVPAIRNFYSGVLLLMRERLRRQSPELIYTDLRPTTEHGVVRRVGTGKTNVDAIQIRKRWESLCWELEWAPPHSPRKVRDDLEHESSDRPLDSARLLLTRQI